MPAGNTQKSDDMFAPKAALLLLLVLCLSCRSVYHTSRQHLSADTLKTVSVIRDSIYVRDSIVTSAGTDTVTVYRTRNVSKYRILTDTVRHYRVDTVFTSQPAQPVITSGPFMPSGSRTLAVAAAAAVILIILLTVRRT